MRFLCTRTRKRRKLDAFKINAGDQQGVLVGTRLDEVNGFELKGIRFVPAKLSRAGQEDQLQLAAVQAPLPAALQPEEKLTARVDLKDGRVLDLQTTVEPPRPKVDLISKNVQPGISRTRSPVHLANQDSLPQDARLAFFLKTEIPETFPHTEKIEVASLRGSFDVQLSMADGKFDLAKFRNGDGGARSAEEFWPVGIWTAAVSPGCRGRRKGRLATAGNIGGLPSLKEVRCPDSPDKQCHAERIESISDRFGGIGCAVYSHRIGSHGFADSNLSVPRPNGTLLYIKLRDDPATVDTLILPVLPEGQ